jgi:Ca2+-binding RTX toxin-like protein
MTIFTATSTSASVGYNPTTIASIDFENGDLASFSGTAIVLSLGAGGSVTIQGNSFAISGDNVTGNVTGLVYDLPTLDVSISGFTPMSMLTFLDLDIDQIQQIAVGGSDSVSGTQGPDMFLVVAGADTVYGNGGNDSIDGGAGRDYLRGDDGNDSILGGADFDDINGNRGNDTAYGGDGDDWVVGGQDQDLLFGDTGFDIVYGNLGNDTINGGIGNDWVRGGQGDDVVLGGDGNDWLWGDRGNDTVTGGAGADLYHSFSGAGIDRITDFSYAQGDRIILDDRTAYAVSQVGGDAVITIGGVDQVILVGVTASSLAGDAIVYA